MSKFCQYLISVDWSHFFASFRLCEQRKKILAVGYLSLLEFFLLSSRKGAKPQRGIFFALSLLCEQKKERAEIQEAKS